MLVNQILSLILKPVFIFLIYFYRTFLGGYFGGVCRFQPTCSQYALDVFKTQPSWTAMRLVFIRLMKCRPLGPAGYDPAPNRERCS